MIQRHPLLALWSALVLLLSLVAPAVAQRGDEGQYQILHARYGTAQQNVDVSERLRELARTDRGIRVGNTTFGVDPHPNEVKTLRIYARGRDGRNRTFEYDEGDVLDGREFTGWAGGDWGRERWTGGWGPAVRRGADNGEYQILHALYGNAQQHVDVTQRLKELAREDRAFRVSNARLGGDPLPNQVKALRIYARGVDGHLRSFEYVEGSEVDGARFTGWGRGDWQGGRWNGGWGEPFLPSSNREGYPPGAGSGYLNIITASYGDEERQVDVTYRLRSQVRSDRLSVRVGNELAGADPAPQTPKALWVVFNVGGGREQRAQVHENDRLRLP